ncbi:MAG TPA: nucleotide synthetase [Allosphingosinicella sp.]|nr:nucleotide synthetase [Allosphingosinicella sp.]
MAYEVLTQFRLRAGPPPNWSTGILFKRLLQLSPETGRGLVFKYAKMTTDPYNLSLSVDEPTIIELTLDTVNDANWRWSEKLEAITTKFDYSILYGEIEYKQNDGSFKTTKQAGYNCMVIRFKARPNKYGGTTANPLLHHPDKNHGFSLNIDILQPDGSILPITLDPDIKNPPPDGGFLDSPFLSAM